MASTTRESMLPFKQARERWRKSQRPKVVSLTLEDTANKTSSDESSNPKKTPGSSFLRVSTKKVGADQSPKESSAIKPFSSPTFNPFGASSNSSSTPAFGAIQPPSTPSSNENDGKWKPGNPFAKIKLTSSISNEKDIPSFGASSQATALFSFGQSKGGTINFGQQKSRTTEENKGENSKTTSKAAGSGGSSYPPISTKAPTTFGSTQKQPFASSYPPLGSEAPTPSGSEDVTGKVSIFSSSYPALSSTAPTPFGSSATKPQGSAAGASPSYPPISTKAPSPFGASQSLSSNGAYPPMSLKAPSPFSVQKPKTAVEKEARNLKQEGMSKSSHRSRLVDFYKKHNPEKIESVDSTLAKYQGKEDELFKKLEAKYSASKFPMPFGEGATCFLEFSIGGEARGKVIVKLYEDKTPIAAENFRCLCTGEKGMGRSMKALCYKNSQVHRVVPSFCVQLGDFTKGNGTGGESIYPPNSEHGDTWGKFKDEGFMQHSKKGLLSMANNGPNANGSQFFFTLRAISHLDGKHVVFGEVVRGMDVIETLAKVPTDKKQRPETEIVVTNCGEIKDGKEIPCQINGAMATSSNKSSPFSFGAPTSHQATSSTFTSSGSTPGKPNFGFGTFALSNHNKSQFAFGASGSSSMGSFGSGTPNETAISGKSQTSANPFTFGAKPSLSGLSSTSPFGSFSKSSTPFSFGTSSSTNSFGARRQAEAGSGVDTAVATEAPGEGATNEGFEVSSKASSNEASAASPFKDVSKVTTSAGSSYPPVSTKAPTPFGSTKKPSGSSYPPLASKAPTPLFGAANKEGPKAPGSAESSYPPVSTKAPTLFGSAQKKPSGGNYPPMASKAPTPFGGVKVTGKTSDSSSSFSSKALTPIGSFRTKPEDVAGDVPPKEANTNPFANLKLTASASKPTTDATSNIFTFGASADKPPVTTSQSASKTGISFGVTKKETKEETGHGTKTSANLGEESSAASPFKDVSKVTTSAGSSYPPMSTKAPTPFGSTKKPSGSSYPPLASKAPTPLFGAANKEGPKAPGSAESSYPPVSTKAPTLFGSAQKKPSGGNYPPMASKAPTPFGGVKGTAGSNLSSSSSPFFSLSSKALTPIGSFRTKPEDVAGDVPPKEANTNPFANLKLTASAPKPTTDANSSIFTFEAMGRQ